MITPLVIAQRLSDLASFLESTDLRPCPAVDRAFGELVDLALGLRHAQATEVLRLLGPRVESIRALCSRGESELESAWGRRICEAQRPAEELTGFPYLENYRALVALELAAVRGLGVDVRRAVVVGSGPLPLTGVLLALDHGLEVTLVDRDPDALQLGDQVVAALGVSGATSVLADAIAGGVDVAGADLVVLAALVGSDGLEKHRSVTGIARAMRPGAHLVVRSAAGLREILYPPSSVEGVAGLTSLLELHPHHDVVNSVLVARRDAEAA